MFSEVTFPILGAHCAMISDDDFSKEMWVGPDIWVPPLVADYLISRMQWVKEGEKTDFQVGAPAGYEVDDLNTLAYLIVTGDFAAAKELADNLPRPQMWMEPSSSLVASNANYTVTNPFKRRRRRKKNRGGESSVQVIFSLPQLSMWCSVQCSILHYTRTSIHLSIHL